MKRLPTRACRKRIDRVSVVQRGRRFWVSYTENGRSVRKPFDGSLQEVLAVAARVNADLPQGAPSLLAFQPIAPRDFLVRWLQYHEHVLRSSVRTIQRYRAAMAHLIEFLEATGIRTLDRITPQVAQAYVLHLRTQPITPNGHPRARKRAMRDKTVLHNLEVARGFLNRARKERHLPPYAENPFAELHFDRMRIDDAKGTCLMPSSKSSARQRATGPSCAFCASLWQCLLGAELCPRCVVIPGIRFGSDRMLSNAISGMAVIGNPDRKIPNAHFARHAQDPAETNNPLTSDTMTASSVHCLSK